MTLILASCTNRKRPMPGAGTLARELDVGPLTTVLTAWTAKVEEAEKLAPAMSLYSGHGWAEAVQAAKTIGADLVAISAGLGVVPATATIPSYGLTVIDAEDDVLRRISPRISASAWWSAISNRRLVAPNLSEVLDAEAGMVLAALPDGYLTMVATDLAESRAAAEGRLRIFTKANATRIPKTLAPFVMPYDARLDDPKLERRGTEGSFATRALRHFVELVLSEDFAGDTVRHGEMVATSLAKHWAPSRTQRSRLDDEAITQLLRENWEKGGGVASRLLRILRDDLGVACEQSRIGRLVKVLKAAEKSDGL